MDKLCTLIDRVDGKREVRYSDERVMPNFFIRSWQFIHLSEEKIQEIEQATTQNIQQILKTL